MTRRTVSVLAVALLLGVTALSAVAAKPPSWCQAKPPSHPCHRSPTPSPSASATPTAQLTAAVTVSPTSSPTATPLPTPVPPNDFAAGASIYHKRIADLDLAVAAGLDFVRIVNWLDESGGGSAFDPARWATIDALVAGAQQRGLAVLLDLSTYRNHLLAKGINPYTADWRPMLDFVDARYPSAIAWLALAGEPEAPNGGNPQRPTTAQLTAFYQTAATYWRSISSVPVESGGLLHYGWNSGIDWRAIFTATGACAVHVYSQGDIDALPTLDAWCDAAGYPFLLEEFGRPQSIGDGPRAAYYDQIYELAYVHSFALVAHWNVGPETYPASHDTNPTTPLTWEVIKRRGLL